MHSKESLNQTSISKLDSMPPHKQGICHPCSDTNCNSLALATSSLFPHLYWDISLLRLLQGPKVMQVKYIAKCPAHSDCSIHGSYFMSLYALCMYGYIITSFEIWLTSGSPGHEMYQPYNYKQFNIFFLFHVTEFCCNCIQSSLPQR